MIAFFRTNNRTNSDFFSATAQHVEANSDTGLPSLLSDEEFEKLRLQRNQLGNTTIRVTAPITDGLPESTIEQRFAHVAEQLCATWGSEACALYINKLVISDRVGREGFPQEVIDDLMMLYQINEIRCREIGINLEKSEDHPARSPYAEISKAAFNWSSMANKKHHRM